MCSTFCSQCRYGRTPSSVSANGRWQPPGQATPGRGGRGRKTRRKLQNIKHLNFPRGNNSNTRKVENRSIQRGSLLEEREEGEAAKKNIKIFMTKRGEIKR